MNSVSGRSADRCAHLGICARLLVLFVLVQLPFPGNAELPGRLNSYSGKTLYIDFWASWCPPCRRAIPWLNQMQDRYSGDDFTIVGISVDESRNAAEHFLAENPVTYPIIFDPSGELAEYFSIQGMPSTVILDSDGSEIARHIGFFSDQTDSYERLIRLVLKVH